MKTKTFNAAQLLAISFAFMLLFCMFIMSILEKNYYKKELNYWESQCDNYRIDFTRAIDSVNYYRHVTKEQEQTIDSLNLLIQSYQPITIAGW